MERTPLPTSASDLPPLDPEFASALDNALRHIDLDLGAAARAAIEAQARLLLAWSQAINLTALRSPAKVAVEHVADSLVAVPLIRRLLGGSAEDSLLDLGSGGGYPGIPLAVVLPVSRAALVDSIVKKARFLSVAADAAAQAMEAAGGTPPSFEIHADRAEALAAGREREGWQLVVARAVAPLAELAELSLPLTALRGYTVAWKRDDGSGALDEECAAARTHVASLGGELLAERERVGVPALADHRLVVIRKVATTPPAYPRPAAERRNQWPRSATRRC